MNTSLILICIVINLIICFGIPIGYLIYAIMKRSGIKAFFIGTLVFFISQILLRIPILQLVLPKMDWYLYMSNFYPIIYSIFLGITAGVFEETGRFIGFKFALKRNRSWSDGIAFGIGHGGIEAMLITGAANIQKLIWLISLNNGTFDSVRFGIDAAKAIEIFNSLTIMGILAAGIERLGAILVHVGLSLIVLYGVNNNKRLYLPLAILIHGLIDATIGIASTAGLGIALIEGILGIYALSLLIYIIKSKITFKEMC
ncbi:MAG: hypothetical protein K0R09_601 [Clostridiales bacterium]|nr:hypothetical protein [Clostridiales bacterium]